MTNENHQSAKTPLCCAVVGVGRMGHHHARVYHDLPQAQLVAVVDADIERAEEVASEFGVSSYTNVEELLNAHSDLDAVSIVVPTVHHYEASRPFLEKQIACLIEKPLAPSVAEAKRIVDLADQTGTILQVGHIERYNPTIRALKNHDPIEPRFIEVHRGRVHLNSVDITALSASARARRGLGRSFQDARLFPSMTVDEAIATDADSDPARRIAPVRRQRLLEPGGQTERVR